MLRRTHTFLACPTVDRRRCGLGCPLVILTLGARVVARCAALVWKPARSSAVDHQATSGGPCCSVRMTHGCTRTMRATFERVGADGAGGVSTPPPTRRSRSAPSRPFPRPAGPQYALRRLLIRVTSLTAGPTRPQDPVLAALTCAIQTHSPLRFYRSSQPPLTQCRPRDSRNRGQSASVPASAIGARLDSAAKIPAIPIQLFLDYEVEQVLGGEIRKVTVTSNITSCYAVTDPVLTRIVDYSHASISKHPAGYQHQYDPELSEVQDYV